MFVEQRDTAAVVYLSCDRDVVGVTKVNQLAVARAIGKRCRYLGGNRRPGVRRGPLLR
jgi:hypothetical protein